MLYNLLESLRIIAIIIAPFMPEAARKMWAGLGLDGFDAVTFDQAATWGLLEAGGNTSPGDPLFPKVET